ncbi:phosphatidylserine decarboxylase-domain-containing protein [Stachybotrys elegans]|uniref:Phosphatidylserine decarboxylase proenzyme 2 n=1 Tax=Stachybotrys elegans TaxID=80388 RepID=A0A8K0T554_9HYPO|nr:phosphatidylserine decarboxylase-domain-containing protein [Stachybotrys elegans]
MVRILPTRLLSSSSIASSATAPTSSPSSSSLSLSKHANRRANSPMRSKSENPSPTRSPGNGLSLKVSILRARNLAPKDRGGTSDPYLVLSLGDCRVTTHAVPKNLNPEWNVVEYLPVNSVQCLILDVICWDKDRFGKDYMGEFDLALEEIFQSEKTETEPTWYPLKSKRSGKKSSFVSGEVQLQFTLVDTENPSATPETILEKLSNLIKSVPVDSSRNATPSMTPNLAPQKIPRSAPASSSDANVDEEDEEDLEEFDSETPDDVDDAKPETAERRRRRLRIKGLRKKRRQNPYAFTSDSSVVGVIFLEIAKITDLPPEHNLTRTSFDMDPFVVVSLGKKTYRTRRVRHSLNPVYNEKMLFHVLAHEQQYSFLLTVIDHDSYSNNDFIASCNLPVKELIESAPVADPETGLYRLPEVPGPADPTPSARPRFKKLGLARSSSSQSLRQMMLRPPLSKSASSTSTTTVSQNQPSLLDPSQAQAVNRTLLTQEASSSTGGSVNGIENEAVPEAADPYFRDYEIPLKMKNLDKWEDKHNPVLYLRAKYMPYAALRQQFWRALLKQYDTDESGCISRVELTTMLDALGSTLSEDTIDGFFKRFPHSSGQEDDDWELTMDEVVICLEDLLDVKSRQPATAGEKLKSMVSDMKGFSLNPNSSETSGASSADVSGISTPVITTGDGQTAATAVPEIISPSEDDDLVDGDGLNTTPTEEHVVEIRECPICHQPRLNKRKDADIITHIATCASQDWRQVNTVLMGGFVTASQAQRKWYSKVITKVTYGGYRLGANSANILVQDRITGQINEEKMSVYVRLGIRLLYKGLKSRDMENKRIRKLLKNLSIKQGKKFDDPASRDEIEKFIAFHGLDMSEVLLPLDEFKNFNEFFYRALKPGSRPCSAPDRSKIIVSPADCRSVVFDQITSATKIWVKGRDFNMKRLLGDAYPEDVARYEDGALGIFRLAPQDYHRFHIPVDGVMGKPKTIEGEYYTVNPMAIRSALDVYGENVRVLVPIDSVEHGRVMVICVGAMMVGSTVITRNEGEQVKRAEELGYFKFGGSTILLLFEPGKMRFDDDLVDNSSGALETLIRVGMSIGHSPDEPQWTPDMRKEDADITGAEKQEAKRRIQGVPADYSPSGSGEEDAPRRKPSAAPTVNTLAASAM